MHTLHAVASISDFLRHGLWWKLNYMLGKGILEKVGKVPLIRVKKAPLLTMAPFVHLPEYRIIEGID